ncbi:HAMP domain-containing protein [Deinococcus aquiradiocola]|uniref:HAMP domain-containing protein n=1 Tax=Deinococcus aquiradiocola TaxID=393059 RepID=UPI00166C49AA|nr:HAMP domain-containing protein [Deinococcus aquiradiocola]
MPTPASALSPARPAPQGGSRSLLARLLTVTVLPVLLLGLFVAAVLGAERMSALRAVDDSLAATVARILGTTLDVSDLTQVAAQLQAAVTADNVEFVDVRPTGDTLRFFRSKTPDTDWALRRAYDAAQTTDPASHRFVFHDTRLALYRDAAARVTDPAVRDRLNRVADTLSGGDRAYQVVRARVYEDRSGQRALQLPGDPAPGGTPLFELGVGVSNTGIETLLLRQQWLVVIACTLAALLAAALAWRATRRVVTPIVHLTRTADRLSLGDLQDPVTLDAPTRTITELHDLALAIERLRTSLALAMTRLRPAPPPSSTRSREP